jgi:RND family efflux transporter MFP subunit
MNRLLVALALLLACHRDAPIAERDPVAVKCVSPSRQSIDQKLSLRGRVATPPGGTLSVASLVGGRIVDVLVREGQKVAAGAVVAVVDDSPSRDALLQAEAMLAQARAAQVNADASLTRTKALVERGIAARQELEDAQAKADAAKAGVSSAAAAADTARRTLGRVQVRASVAAVVTRVDRGKGALVDGTPATPIVELAASSLLDFVAAATQRELAGLRVGQTVSAQLLDSGETLTGAVSLLPSALDPQTGLGTVRVALDLPEAAVPIGAFGRLSVTTERRDNALVLPEAALRGAVADGAEIVVCKGGKAEVRAIQVGFHDDRIVEVLGGVTDQEHVAVDHVLGLETDVPIREAP